MKQITFKQYRAIDLFMLCLITVIFETVATLAMNEWFRLQAMAISITLSITCIAFMRWSAWGVIPCLVGSATYCFVSAAEFKQYLIYCIGSLFCLFVLPFLNKLEKKKIQKSFLRRAIFATLIYTFVAFGRWLVSLIFSPSISTFTVFITSEILSLLFAIIILYICKNLDGVIEDQRSYLLRLDAERRAEQEAYLNDNF